MSTDESAVDAAKSRMAARRSAFVATLSPDLKRREDALPDMVARENASARLKLQRVYRLLDEFSELRKTHVACMAGCADCCRMNVQISALEAEQIATAIGRKAIKLQASIRHPLDKFSGSECPFLKDDTCSVYEARPSACRLHASFDTDAYWCEPSRSAAIEVPMVRLDGAIRACSELAIQTRSMVADIRDFFPPT